jgi:hypothetical protein
METYWHWLQDDGRLQFGTKELVEVGVTLKCEEPIELCRTGFHASKRAIDALQFAPGALICCVSLGGKILEGSDKVVAEERTVLWRADATNTLHEFACWCAEEALKTAKVEDVRCWAAIETKRKWLKGEATYEQLTAAWDAAWAAAWAAAWDAARDAAMAAAMAAARERHNTRLTEMLLELKPQD